MKIGGWRWCADPARPGLGAGSDPLGVAMVAVLVAVLVMAASIWIAIFLEPRLGMLPTRATLARVSQPASCRFRHGAARPAVRRPVRCTQGVRAQVVDLRERGQLVRAMGDPQQRPVARAPAPPGERRRPWPRPGAWWVRPEVARAVGQHGRATLRRCSFPPETSGSSALTHSKGRLAHVSSLSVTRVVQT